TLCASAPFLSAAPLVHRALQSFPTRRSSDLNVSIDGLEPFEEQGWMGRHLRIGSARFRVELPIRRCLAPHANPETGERDQPILRSEEHTSELQSRENLVCRLLLEKKKSPWSL